MSNSLYVPREQLEKWMISREREDERFRTFLKNSKHSDKDLDAIVQRITKEVWSDVDCQLCGHCCKGLKIIVDEEDIFRLAVKFGKDSYSFRRKHVSQFKDDHSLYFTKTPCVFLAENSCTVYDDRPTACRDFPYVYKERFRTRLWGMITFTGICPVVHHIWARLKEELSFRRTIKRR